MNGKPTPQWSWRRLLPFDDEGQKVAKLRQEINDYLEKLFEEMWRKIGATHHGLSGRALSRVPTRTDMCADGGCFSISVELPGVHEDDLDVLVTDDTLTVTGEKKVEREETGSDYILAERTFGRFRRTYSLPPGLKIDKTRATLENGVLIIDLPRKAKAAKSGRKVSVKAA